MNTLTKKLVLIVFIVSLLGCKSEVTPATTTNKPTIGKKAIQAEVENRPKPHIELKKGITYSSIRVYDYLSAHDLGYKEIGLKDPVTDPIFASLSHIAQNGLTKMASNMRLTKVNKAGKTWEIHFMGKTDFGDPQDEKEFMLMIKKTLESYTYDYKVFLNNQLLNLG